MLNDSADHPWLRQECEVIKMKCRSDEGQVIYAGFPNGTATAFPLCNSILFRDTSHMKNCLNVSCGDLQMLSLTTSKYCTDLLDRWSPWAPELRWFSLGHGVHKAQNWHQNLSVMPSHASSLCLAMPPSAYTLLLPESSLCRGHRPSSFLCPWSTMWKCSGVAPWTFQHRRFWLYHQPSTKQNKCSQS